jgi:hypothetical protein
MPSSRPKRRFVRLDKEIASGEARNKREVGGFVVDIVSRDITRVNVSA